jgi:hypothetical protein
MTMAVVISETFPRRGKMVDRVQAFSLELRDKPGELRYVSKHELHIDPTYQREAINPKIVRMTSGWSWLRCGVITVSRRGDGTLWVIDGQHRVLSSRRRSDIMELPCIIFDSIGVEDEAAGFVDVNTGRAVVSAIERHRASRVMRDEVALFIDKVAQDLGFRFEDDFGDLRAIKCVDRCKQFAAIDRADFVVAMQAACRACVKDNVRMHQRLIHAMWYLQRHGRFVQDPRFVDRVVAIGAQNLLDAAQKAVIYFNKSGEKIWAEAMLQEINKNLRNKFVLQKGE